MPLAAFSFRFRHAGLTAGSAFGAPDEPAGPYAPSLDARPIWNMAEMRRAVPAKAGQNFFFGRSPVTH